MPEPSPRNRSETGSETKTKNTFDALVNLVGKALEVFLTAFKLAIGPGGNSYTPVLYVSLLIAGVALICVVVGSIGIILGSSD